MCLLMWDQSPKCIGPTIWDQIMYEIMVCFGSQIPLETWVLKNKTHPKVSLHPIFHPDLSSPSFINAKFLSLSSKQDLTRKFFFVMSSNHEEVVTQDYYNKSTFSIYPTTWRCSTTTWRCLGINLKLYYVYILDMDLYCPLGLGLYYFFHFPHVFITHTFLVLVIGRFPPFLSSFW